MNTPQIRTTVVQKMIYSKAASWKIFDAIYARYDLLNAILSFGIDSAWRKKLLDFIGPAPNLKILDLATGTADVAITIAKNTPESTTILATDLSENMLGLGQKKIELSGLSSRIALKMEDASKLSFREDKFDIATMAFGIRNVENPIFVLKEIYRVLKSNGRAIILEFSLPQNIFVRGLCLIYLKCVVPLLGGLISGNFRAYLYLNRTIEKFPYGQMFARMMRQCGFVRVSVTPLLLGVATIYCGEKS